MLAGLVPSSVDLGGVLLTVALLLVLYFLILKIMGKIW